MNKEQEPRVKQHIVDILTELKKYGQCDEPEHLADNFMFNFGMGADPNQTIRNLHSELIQWQDKTVYTEWTKSDSAKNDAHYSNE